MNDADDRNDDDALEYPFVVVVLSHHKDNRHRLD